MQGQKERKYFFIKKFLVVLAGIAMSELILNVVYNNWVYPFLRSHFSLGIFTEEVSGSAIYSILPMIGWIFLYGILQILPDSHSALFYILFNRLFGNGQWGIGNLTANQLDEVQSQHYFLGLLLLFLSLLVLLLPYFIGALVYSRAVRRQLQIILDEENHQHQEFERKRSRMLSDIAHDLKTPITTVAGYAQALSEGMVESGEKQQEYLEAISRKSIQINELIQLLYEYVKLDSEGFTLKREETDMAELLREIVASAYSDMEEAHMELDLQIPEEKIYYLVDRVQFSRAISNLLNNAIRHNDQHTRILVRMEPQLHSHSWNILVADSGVEIPPDVARHIFEPFVMGDESRSSKGGSGLGMSITYKIIKMHGWQLSLEEQIGGYTKAFVVSLTAQI